MKHTLVSKKTRNIELKIRACTAMLLLLLAVKPLSAVELRQETLRAWDEYIQNLDAHAESQINGGGPFLMADNSPDLQRRLQGDELVVTNHDPRRVPQGMIHDWVGIVFIPNVNLDQAMSVLTNYQDYSEVYKQVLASCSVLERNGDNIEISAVAVQKALSVTAAVATDNQIHIERLDSKRVYITSNAARIQEIADYGKPNEHPYPENRRPGYVWRAVVNERLEERDGGVYVEIETVALTRGIPIAFRWLIKPLTDELPRHMMTDMLNDTRAVLDHGESVALK